MKQYLSRGESSFLQKFLLILLVVLLWGYGSDLLNLLLPSDRRPYWSMHSLSAIHQLHDQNSDLQKVRLFIGGGGLSVDCQLIRSARTEQFQQAYEDVSSLLDSDPFLRGLYRDCLSQRSARFVNNTPISFFIYLSGGENEQHTIEAVYQFEQAGDNIYFDKVQPWEWIA